MRRSFVITAAVLGLLLVAPLAQADAVDELLAVYRTQGASEPSAARGEALWKRAARESASGREQSCATCHGHDLRAAGKHAKTGKVIDPMAPSVNPKRLTDPAFVEKWFGRNCRGTWGRECTAQEKSDFLVYLRKQ